MHAKVEAGEAEAAVALVEDALEYSPESPLLLEAAAAAYLSQDRLDEAYWYEHQKLNATVYDAIYSALLAEGGRVGSGQTRSASVSGPGRDR